MAEDNRSLIRKFFNPYPEPTSVQDLGKTGKKYFVGSDKGLSSYFKDYTDPNITVGETLAKGVGSGLDAILEGGLGAYDSAMRVPQGILGLFTAKSPFAGDYVNYADDDYEQLENEEDYLKTLQDKYTADLAFASFNKYSPQSCIWYIRSFVYSTLLSFVQSRSSLPITLHIPFLWLFDPLISSINKVSHSIGIPPIFKYSVYENVANLPKYLNSLIISFHILLKLLSLSLLKNL